MNWEIKTVSMIVLAVFSASSSLLALDRDGGDISDVWEAHHSYGPLVATADDDGDGLINLLEYYFDLNPFAHDANYLEIELVSGTSLEVSFLAPTGQRFKFTRTDDLVDAEWLDIEEGGEAVFTGTGDYEVYEEDPTSIQKAFFRVVALGALDEDSDRLDAFEESLIGTSDTTADSDAGGGDGMRDDYEWINGLDPLVDDASGDKDSDGTINARDARSNDNTAGEVAISISYPTEGATIP